MPVYELGTAFRPGVIHWPEHTEYTLPEVGQGQELHLYRRGVTAADADALTNGAGDLAAAYAAGVLFLLHRFDKGSVHGDWSATAFRRGHTNRMRPPKPGQLVGATTTADEMSAYLVDADTGVLRGQRRLAMPPLLASGLRAALLEEGAKPFHGDHAYLREITRAQSHYSSASAMIPHAFVSWHFDRRDNRALA